MHRPFAFGLRRTFQIVLLGSALLATAPAVAAVRVGDAAPSCALTDASGRAVELASFRGRVVILDFTASWCVACRTALPALEALGRRYADRGVAVVTVVIDATRADADRFLATVVPGHTMTVLYDPAARALARFGAAGMPAHYVLDPRGVVRMVASGYTDDRIAALEATVTRLLAEPERAVPAAP